MKCSVKVFNLPWKVETIWRNARGQDSWLKYTKRKITVRSLPPVVAWPLASGELGGDFGILFESLLFIVPRPSSLPLCCSIAAVLPSSVHRFIWPWLSSCCNCFILFCIIKFIKNWSVSDGSASTAVALRGLKFFRLFLVVDCISNECAIASFFALSDSLSESKRCSKSLALEINLNTDCASNAFSAFASVLFWIVASVIDSVRVSAADVDCNLASISPRFILARFLTAFEFWVFVSKRRSFYAWLAFKHFPPWSLDASKRNV